MLGRVFRSYYLPIYSPSKLLVGVFPCKRATSSEYTTAVNMTVTLDYEISIRMLTLPQIIDIIDYVSYIYAQMQSLPSRAHTEEVGQDHVRLRKSPIKALGMQGM